MLRLFHLPFSATTLDQVMQEISDSKAENQTFIATFINPHAYYLAQKNTQYAQMLEAFNMVLPDGIAVAKAAQYFLKAECARLSFDTTSLAFPVFEWAQKNQKSVIFVGGKAGITDHAAQQIKTCFKQLNIVACYDGYTPKDILVQNIIGHNADLVICGMGAPHQEEVLLKLKTSNWHGVGFTCGGYFDQLSEGLTYYPAWIDRYNLRFLYRIFKEPKRLWRRYFIEYRVFIKHCLRAFFQRTSQKHDS